MDRTFEAISSNSLKNLVDLVGIEPTTSSMPWKRAPSCATGPHTDRNGVEGVTAFILAGKNAIVKRRVK